MDHATKYLTRSDPLVTVVIPTHNRKEKLARLINSLRHSTYRNLEIVVVDDASNDGTLLHVEQNFPDVMVVRNEKVRLLAASRNEGMRRAKGNYLLVIDDDNIVDKFALERLVEFMERNPSVGISAPITLCYEDPDVICLAGIRRNYYTSRTTILLAGRRYSSSIPATIESEDCPNALFVRRDVISHVGLFNEKDFPINYDEADFCKRVSQAGYKILTYTPAKIWHDAPLIATTDKGAGIVLRILEVRRTYYSAYNRILFHRKYNTPLQLITFAFSLQLLILYTVYNILAMKTNVHGKLKALKAYLRGSLDAALSRSPDPPS